MLKCRFCVPAPLLRCIGTENSIDFIHIWHLQWLFYSGFGTSSVWCFEESQISLGLFVCALCVYVCVSRSWLANFEEFAHQHVAVPAVCHDWWWIWVHCAGRRVLGSFTAGFASKLVHKWCWLKWYMWNQSTFFTWRSVWVTTVDATSCVWLWNLSTLTKHGSTQ